MGFPSAPNPGTRLGEAAALVLVVVVDEEVVVVVGVVVVVVVGVLVVVVGVVVVVVVGVVVVVVVELVVVVGVRGHDLLIFLASNEHMIRTKKTKWEILMIKDFILLIEL